MGLMTGISKTIDSARVGLSKSLMTTPCERKGWYGEHLRDEQGRRLRFAMPERVTFGKAVDVAHGYIVWHEQRKLPWTLEKAVAQGIEEASADTDSWSLVTDRETFGIQVATAMRKFVNDPDGLARLLPHLDGLRIQGDDGRTLKAGDVIGTPDYWLADGSILDVKTATRRYGEDKFWQSPEMGVYALLSAAESGGAIPPRVIYQVYVRVNQPYWMWLEMPGSADLVEIGRDTADHWREVVAFDSATKAAANPMFCRDCPFATPLPDLGFEGCSVGRRMPREEEAA